MVPELRREAILKHLNPNSISYLDDILKVFNHISESTLRRDLKVLEDSKKVELLRGGAIRLVLENSNDNYEEKDLDINIKKQLNISKKNLICKYAASLVNDKDVIYIDSGTTCSRLIDFLLTKEIVIVTSNINIIEKYKKLPKNIEIISVGGRLNAELGSLSGPLTENNLRTFHFDKAFLGTTSINTKSGVTTPDLSESIKKQIVKQNSNESYILVDSSKFNKFAMCKVFDLKECDIITDKYVDFLDNCKSYQIVE